MRERLLFVLAAACASVMLADSSALAAGPGNYVYGEFLSMTARRRDMDFVIVDPNDDTDPQGNQIGLDYDTDSGARVGLGRRTARGWELGVEYQTYETDDYMSVDQPVGGRLWGTRLHPDSVVAASGATNATASASLDYDVVDLTVGRRFLLDDCENIQLTLLGGFRYAVIDQGLGIQYVDAVNARTADVTHITRLDGYGVRIGGELGWTIAGRLRVFGRVAGSVLAAEVDSVYTELDTTGTGSTTPVDVSESYYQVVPVIETALGVAYQYKCWEVALGYEMTAWCNAGERLDFSDDVDDQKHTASSSDLLLDGVFFRVGFNR